MDQLRQKKKLVLLLLMGLFLLIFVPFTMALEEQSGDNVTIAAGEVIADDLYVGANTFVLNGTVEGDLIVGATEILINGIVEGDLLAGGQSVVINGTIGDDARIGAMAIALGEGAEIGDDLIAAGYSLHGQSGSLVGGELAFAGFQALLEGDVTENVWIVGNNLRVNGRIAGNLTAEVGAEDAAPPFNPYQFMPDAPSMPVVPSGLMVDEAAEIGGDLTYRAFESFDIPSGAIGGEVDFTREIVKTDEGQPTTAEIVWRYIRRFITLALFGTILIWRAPNFILQISDKLQEKPLPSLGWGAVIYFGVPIFIFILFIATILLALLLGALQFGNLSSVLIFAILAVIFAFMVAFVFVLLYLTKIILGYFVGHFILQRVNPTLAETPYWPLLLGLLLIVLLIAIPWLGGLVNWMIALAGVGALWLLWRGATVPAEKIV